MILKDHNGIVCIAYIGFNQHFPKREYTLFRTEVKTRDLEMNYAPLNEICVEREHSYYRITRNGARYDQSLVLYTTGNTNLLISEDIPQPKVRSGIQTRWNGDKGQWEKLLKTGWCMA